MSNVRLRDIGLLVLLGAIWGTSFTFIKDGLDSFDPIWFAALRYDIAGLLMLGVAFVVARDRMLPKGRTQWYAVWVAAVLNVLGYHAFLFWGEQFTTGAIAGVIVSLNPLMATVASRALLPQERVGWLGVLGLFSGIVGIAVLVGLKPGALFDSRGVGELAIVACVACWGLGATLVKRSKHGMDVIPFTAAQMVLGAGLLHLVSLAMEGTAPKTVWNRSSLIALAYLALLASAVGFFIYFTLLDRIGPIRSTLVSYIAPIFATLGGMVLLGEPFELRSLFAFVLIASGFRLVIRPAPDKGRPTTALAAGKAEGQAAPVRVVWDDVPQRR